MLIVPLVVLNGLILSPAQAGTPKPGATCAILNESVVSNGYTYTCSRSGKKMVWSSGLAQVWKTGPQVVNGWSVLCSAGNSNLKDCQFNYYITNVSKVPRSYAGDLFALSSDGSIYQAVPTSRFTNGAGAGTLNPGETQSLARRFELPSGTKIVSLFKATSPQGSHIYEVPFAITIS